MPIYSSGVKSGCKNLLAYKAVYSACKLTRRSDN